MRLGGALLVALALLLPAAPDRAAEAGSGVSRLLNDSPLLYDISFLWFDRLAEGELGFAATTVPGRYRAVLEARTLGVAAWLTGYRAHRYLSEMEELPDGKLRSLRHETHVLKGKGDRLKDRSKEYRFDYEHGTVVYRRARDDAYSPEQFLPLPEQPVNDFLTAFCNFSRGYYGFPAAGETLTLPTFERDGVAQIHIKAVPVPGEHREFFPVGGQLFEVRLGEDILDTGGGKVYLWFDPELRPARGIVEGVIGIGHVRGVLQRPDSTP